jgi:O-antigen ligase
VIIFLFYTYCGGIWNPGTPESNALSRPESTDGSLLNQLMLIGIFALTATIFMYSRVSWSRVLRGVAPFIGAVLLVAISVAWAADTELSARRSIRFVIELATLLLMSATYRDEIDFLRVLCVALGTIVVLDLATLAVPSIAFTPIGFKGVHVHKNQAGSFAFVALPCFLAATFERRVLRSWLLPSLLAVCALGILVISASKTGLILTFVCGFLTFYCYALTRTTGSARACLTFLFLVSFMIAGSVVVLADWDWNDVLTHTVGDPTFTGREQVWNFSIWRISQAPWLGYGYGDFWGLNREITDLMQRFGITFDFGQAHNGYIDVLGNLGLLGLVVVVVMLAHLGFGLIQRSKSGTALSLLGVFSFFGFCFYNITESSVLRAGVDSWVFFVLLSSATLMLVPVRRGIPTVVGVRPSRVPAHAAARRLPISRWEGERNG